MACKISSKNTSAGQSLTEIAFALPLLIVIVTGVIDLGRVYFTYVSLVNAAREGARYGAGLECRFDHASLIDEASVINKTKAETSSEFTLADSDIQITYPDGSCDNGNSIKVTATTNFHLITAEVLGGAVIPLTSFTQFQLYHGHPN